MGYETVQVPRGMGESVDSRLIEFDVFESSGGVPVLVEEPRRLMSRIADGFRPPWGGNEPLDWRVYGPVCISMQFYTRGPVDWDAAYWVASLVLAQLADRRVIQGLDRAHVRSCDVEIVRGTGYPCLAVRIAKLP